MGEETTLPAKAGYKSTEFWLSLVAVIAGFLLASGAVVEGSQTATIVGGVLTVLGALGYTKGRTAVKVAAETAKAEESKIAGYIALAKEKVEAFRESRRNAEAELEVVKEKALGEGVVGASAVGDQPTLTAEPDPTDPENV